MKDLHQIHRDITDEVKHTIQDIRIVFPAQYGRLYTELAHQYNIELTPEELVTREMLDEKMVRHVISLYEFADQALEAMETNNMIKLQDVIEETKKLKDEIQHLQEIIYEDPLTKSYNRKWLEDTFLSGDKGSFRQNGTLVVADLNRFKAINDTYGHVVGDKVLKHVALKLKESEGEIVRYGGDEFVILFTSSFLPEHIEVAMEKILHYFEKIAFKVEKGEFKIGFSYGMASFTSDSLLENVIEKADHEMYRHKRGEKILAAL
ncbi:MAG: GGDEF domain-containing protein [Sulfuricurvum sp.]|nr:GGDEF domain-containing protein [Sulfuricurvum sp.]